VEGGAACGESFSFFSFPSIHSPGSSLSSPSPLSNSPTNKNTKPTTILTFHLPQIKYTELPTFTEVAAAGTAAALVPIKSITLRSANETFKYQGGGDEPGPAVIKLLKQLQGIQRGLVEDPFGWVQTVKEFKEGEYESDKIGGKSGGGEGGEKVLSQLP
jgi:hypothetical protein